MPACPASQECCSQSPQPSGRPPLTYASARLPNTHRLSLPQPLVASPLLFPGSWCAQDFACVLQVSLFPSSMEVCNQISLSFKVKFPGGSQSLCWIPRLGSLLWGLELLQQWLRTSLEELFSSLEKRREIASEGMKKLSQSGNYAQLWMCLVVKEKSAALKNSIT